MTGEPLGSWQSAEYAAQWAGDDAIADLLTLPRRISVELVRDSGLPVSHIVDLGSGPGAYLELFLHAFPDARGTWIDVSEAMLELARERLAPLGARIEYVVADVDQPGLDVPVADVVVTSRVLHHFSPEALARLYRSVHGALAPGGFFFNLDHVGAPGDWEQTYRRIRSRFVPRRRERLKPHRHDYPLARVDEHIGWLEEAGFAAPDTPWRTLYTALLVARKS